MEWKLRIQSLYIGNKLIRKNSLLQCHQTFRLKQITNHIIIIQSHHYLQAYHWSKRYYLTDEVLKYRNGKDRFTMWDLGGKSSIRKIWENYYSECHGVVYLFNHNIEEGVSTLKNVLAHQEMIKIPIALIATNQNERQCLQAQLNEVQSLKNRKHNLYIVSIQKMQYMKTKIKQILHTLYVNIRELHEEVKQ